MILYILGLVLYRFSYIVFIAVRSSIMLGRIFRLLIFYERILKFIFGGLMLE